MLKPTCVAVAVGFLGRLLTGCTTKTEQSANSALQSAATSSNSVKHVTLHVEGMTKVQGIA